MAIPLLILHGALGSERQFLPLRTLLRSREVYTLDFEGHGEFSSEAEFSISLFRENVLSFLKERNISEVDIFGYSMGGYVALDLAFQNPSFVRRILTLGTKFAWNPQFASQEVRMLDPNIIQQKVPAFAAQLEKLHGRENWRKVVLKTASLMQDLGAKPPLQESELSKIAIPVQICLGKLDTMSTEEESVHVSEILQNGTFLPIENFKHPIEKVPLDEVAQIIETFLNQKTNNFYNDY